MPPPPIKPLRFAPVSIETHRRADGSLLLRSSQELAPYPRSLGELLRRWAAEAPERIFLAERQEAPDGGWRTVTYGATLAAIERLAGALLARGLGPHRPLAILSDNGVDNGLLQLAALHVGIPVAPISPAYSLLSADHTKLRSIVALTRPGLIYADDGAAFAAALDALDAGSLHDARQPGGAAAASAPEIVVSVNPPAGRAITLFADLLAAPLTTAEIADVAARFADVGPDTIAKILFTSGSTGAPKGVINTQRMLCSNQQAIAQCWPFLEDRPPVIVDWLPWSHTFGGNHNFNMMLRNGGSLYIDRGRPTPAGIADTVRNLRDVPSTLHFNVPRGFDMLLPHLESDAALCETFFRDLDVIFYASAALPQHLWRRLEELAVAATGRRVAMLAAWGSTETAPCATQVHFPIERAGVIGLPIPGTEIKLAPAPGSPGKLELRVKGPNVTPGYWPAPLSQSPPSQTAPPRDDEGFLAMGDAGRLADPADPSRGLVFDGRLAESFKLSSGTWVHVGELRIDVLAAAPLLQDAVLTGHDQPWIGLLAFPNPAACRALCAEAGEAAAPPPASATAAAPPPPSAAAPLAELIRHSAVRRRLAVALAAHNAANPASSRRIRRALLLVEPPSIDAGEITDKGYVNQRAVLDRRAALVARLHAPARPAGGAADPDVIDLADPADLVDPAAAEP
jgi:feruloyl-CoA synthase